MKTFTPEKLNEAKREIVSLHKKTAQNKGTFSDSELKKLIQKIVSLEENKIKKYAIALSNDEVCAITKYIPANFYSVNCKNLFEVLKWRKNSKIMNVFYKEWQNNFRNAKCNFYIIDMIHEDSGFASYFAEMHLDTERLECILKSESIPGVFGNLCYTVQLPDNTSFDERMQFFGISKETMLYKDVKSLYYTFCSRNDYLATDEGELLRVLQRYAKEQIKAFFAELSPFIFFK